MNGPGAALPARVATSVDVDRIVDTITSAFFDDPVWGPAFPDAEHRGRQAARFWRLLVASALRYPCTFVTEQVESAAVWCPPGGSELTDAESAGLEDFLVDNVGRSAAHPILELFEKFELVRPDEPHFYLSLLATHGDHRGRGLGMALLRENLGRVDAFGAAAYLESTNPANNRRYRSVGFERLAEFAAPSGQLVTTMWRSPRP